MRGLNFKSTPLRNLDIKRDYQLILWYVNATYLGQAQVFSTIKLKYVFLFDRSHAIQENVLRTHFRSKWGKKFEKS